MRMRCSECFQSLMLFLCGPRYVFVYRAILAFCLSLKQIRGAIQEYQTQLIDSVKDDIKHLHEKVSFFIPLLPPKKHHI